MTNEKMVPAMVSTPRRHGEQDPLVVESLCPFSFSGGDGSILQAMLSRPFRPKGLMLWDVPDDAQLMIFIGTDLQLIASFGPLPARWFSAFESFQQVAAKLDQGLEPPAWGTFSAVHPGVVIRLAFQRRTGEGYAQSEGLEKVQALMWGHSVSP